MENIQGAEQIVSATPLAQGADPLVSAGVVDPIIPASAEPSAVNQGGNQGVVMQPEEIQRQIQSGVDKVQARFLAEKYELQQQLNQLQQRMQPQVQQNPHDYSTDFPNWFRYEQNQSEQRTAERATKASMDGIQNMIAQANESNWIQSHPNVDIHSLKAFNRMNGIADWNLEAGFKLMNYPSQIQQVAQTASNQTAQNFRQPITGAQPIRPNGGQPVGQPTYKYEDLVKAVSERGEGVLQSLPQADRDEFWRTTHELNQRMKSGAPIY
jgi:hypothetical protein